MARARPTVLKEALAFGRHQALNLLATGGLLGVGAWLAYVRLVDVAPVLAGVVVGTLATIFVWFVVWVLWVSSGLSQRLQSALADEWTGTALHRLRLRGNWHLVPRLRAGGEVIDHVLTCPAGVVAVEAKWSVQPWVADDVSRAAERAAVKAAAVERIVHAAGDTVPVRAAIVVWGPASRGLARRQVPMGRHLVDLVPAHELKPWSRRLRRGPVERAQSAAVAEVVAVAAARSVQSPLDAPRPRTSPVMRWLTRPR